MKTEETNPPAEAPSFLDEKIAEISGRRKELEPLVGEYNRLTVALDALGGPLPEDKPKRGGRGRS